MENTIQTKPIGIINVQQGMYSIQLDEAYRSGLTNINGFSHLQIVWWGHLFDKAEHRKVMINKKPYKKSPAELGVFATRSQFRPNPILITTIYVEKIDLEKRFSGSFPNKDIKIALETISNSMNLDYSIKNKKVILRTR